MTVFEVCFVLAGGVALAALVLHLARVRDECLVMSVGQVLGQCLAEQGVRNLLKVAETNAENPSAWRELAIANAVAKACKLLGYTHKERLVAVSRIWRSGVCGEVVTRLEADGEKSARAVVVAAVDRGARVGTLTSGCSNHRYPDCLCVLCSGGSDCVSDGGA